MQDKISSKYKRLRPTKKGNKFMNESELRLDNFADPFYTNNEPSIRIQKLDESKHKAKVHQTQKEEAKLDANYSTSRIDHHEKEAAILSKILYSSHRNISDENACDDINSAVMSRMTDENIDFDLSLHRDDSVFSPAMKSGISSAINQQYNQAILEKNNVKRKLKQERVAFENEARKLSRKLAKDHRKRVGNLLSTEDEIDSAQPTYQKLVKKRLKPKLEMDLEARLDMESMVLDPDSVNPLPA